MPAAVCSQFHPSFILGNISDDLNYLKIQFDDATFLINLPAFKREIGFKNVISCLKSKNSFKSIALLLCAVLLTVGKCVLTVVEFYSVADKIQYISASK